MERIMGKFDKANVKNTVRLLNVGCDKRGDWYNCMGYALGLREWLRPVDFVWKDYGDRCNWINETMDFYGFDEDETNDYVLNFEVNALMERFGLRKALPSEIEDETVDLIAFREGNHFGENPYYGDGNVCYESDFHFRKRVDGVWTEKLGSGPIRVIEGDNLEDFDEHWNGYYFGEIVYLVKEN